MEIHVLQVKWTLLLLKYLKLYAPHTCITVDYPLKTVTARLTRVRIRI